MGRGGLKRYRREEEGVVFERRVRFGSGERRDDKWSGGKWVRGLVARGYPCFFSYHLHFLY